MPYLHGGFSVENLPDGVQFKRPFHYGAKQLKMIMENKDKIKFLIHTNEKPDTSNTVNTTVSHTLSAAMSTLLSKVVGKEVADRVVRMSEKVTEEEVEVMHLMLEQEERLLLTGCRHLFEDDAWHAVGANIQHSTQAQGLVVPVFTDSEDEHFWLFYTVHNPSKLVKASNNHKIKGYWLDLEDQSKYTLLNNHQDSVTFVNLIRNGPHGPLYFLHNMEIADHQHFHLPEIFRNAIFAALRQNSLI